MSISLCMIAKDEEDFIGQAIKSTLNFVDEIILVDTGSKDETMTIAKNLGAKIITSTWRENFSYHRNEALAYATGDWILFLDCDEVLEEKGQTAAKTTLEKKDNMLMGYNVNVVNVISNTPIASFNALRLFKNNEGFTFEKPIHEQIILSIEKKYGLQSIGTLPLTINHFGYDDKLIKNKDKISRNLSILHCIEFKDGYTYAMIGDEYVKSCNYDKAVEYYELSLATDGNIYNDYSTMLIINYLTALINLWRFTDATAFLDNIMKMLPEFKDLYFLKFWILFHTAMYKEALIMLEKYISFFNSSQPYIEVKKFENIYDINHLKSVTSLKSAQK